MEIETAWRHGDTDSMSGHHLVVTVSRPKAAQTKLHLGADNHELSLGNRTSTWKPDCVVISLQCAVCCVLCVLLCACARIDLCCESTKIRWPASQEPNPLVVHKLMPTCDNVLLDLVASLKAPRSHSLDVLSTPIKNIRAVPKRLSWCYRWLH